MSLKTPAIWSGTNVINGGLNWQAGSWNTRQPVTIATNSTVIMARAAATICTSISCPVTNYGTFAWSSGYPDGGSSPGTVIYNYGLWDCQSDYNFKDDTAVQRRDLQ